MSGCWITPTQQFLAISWREQVTFQWNDDEVRFVLDQHTVYVVSLSNISIKSNFKQITRVELIFTIFFAILSGRIHFVHDVTLFVAGLSPMSNY